VAVGLGLFAPSQHEGALAGGETSVPQTPVPRSVPPSTPPAAAPQPPASAPVMGDLVTPATERNHRVWVDGRIAAWSSGGLLRVPCGTHVVRIGSAGESRTVFVPCGGQAIVQAH
jgi:hypothetical protein